MSGKKLDKIPDELFKYSARDLHHYANIMTIIEGGYPQLTVESLVNKLAKNKVEVDITSGSEIYLYKSEDAEITRRCYSISEMHAALNTGPIFFDYPFTYKGKKAEVATSNDVHITLVLNGNPENLITLDRIGIDAKLKQNPEVFTDNGDSFII